MACGAYGWGAAGKAGDQLESPERLVPGSLDAAGNVGDQTGSPERLVFGSLGAAGDQTGSPERLVFGSLWLVFGSLGCCASGGSTGSVTVGPVAGVPVTRAPQLVQNGAFGTSSALHMVQRLLMILLVPLRHRPACGPGRQSRVR